MDNQIQVISRPALICAPTRSTVAHGATVADIVADKIAGTPAGVVIVEIQGYPLARSMWEIYVPRPGQEVYVYTTTHGEGKNPLAMILSIVVIAAAAYVSGPAGAAALGSEMAATFAGAAIMAAGSFIISLIAPPIQPDTPDYSYSDSPTYSLSGARNVATPWGPVPVVLGRHRVYPPLGAQYYTEIVGNDEYLRIMLVFGYGPLLIEDIKIGDTPIENFDHVQLEVREGWPVDEELTLFPNQVDTVTVGTEISNGSGWITRTAPAYVDEIVFDLQFLRGLVGIDSELGTRYPLTINLQARYREVGSPTWINLDGTIPFIGRVWTVSEMRNSSWTYITTNMPGTIYMNPDQTLSMSSGTAYISEFARPIATYTVSELGWDDSWGEGGRRTYGFETLTNIPSADKTGMELTMNPDRVSVTIADGSFIVNSLYYTGKSPEVQRYSYHIPVDRNKQYEVSIRRVTADSTSDYETDEITWTVLRGILYENPLNFPFPVAAMAMRIKATGQLSGVVDDINAVCTSICSVWNGSDWGDVEPTRNNAALYRHVLTGKSNPRPRTVNQIHDDDLADWYDYCVLKGYRFDMYRDYRSSVPECLADICRAGTSSPLLVDGKWSVAVDRFDKAIEQHFTPRNSWGFSAEKILADQPHAVRVKFKNEDIGWQWDELIVYADGYDSSTAELYEAWEFPGVTNADMIWKLARRRMAITLLRPELYSFYADFEHLCVQRGSLIRFSHDVILVGSGSGRIKSISTRDVAGTDMIDTITTDETFTMEAGPTYGIRIRRKDNTSQVLVVDTVAGESNQFTCLGIDYEISAGPEVGDLFSFGTSGNETGEYVVYSIEPIDDLNAKLVIFDYSPAIDTSDSGTIPPFDSNITLPLDITMLKPDAPTITNVESGTRALEVTGNTIRPRIIVDIEPAASNIVRLKAFRLRYRLTEDATWSYVEVPYPTASCIIPDVLEGQTYEIQVQSVSIYDKASDWSAAVTETVAGLGEPPSDVQNFRIEIIGSNAFLTWDPVTDIDFRMGGWYVICFSTETSGATWDQSIEMLNPVPNTAVSAVVPARQGTFLIKAFDRNGNSSENATGVVNAYGDILDLNVVETLTEDPDWAGTHDQTEAIDESLRLSSGTYEYGYYYFDNELDLGDVYTCRIDATLVSGALNLLVDIFARADFFGVDDFFGTAVGQWNVVAQIRTTDDDPTGSPTWSEWRSFNIGDFTFRAAQFRLYLQSLSSGVTPVVIAAEVEVDMPDRQIAGSDLVCPVAGLRINFSPAFLGFKGIGFAYQDLDTGDYALVSNKDETGFDINFYDATDTAIERTFDYVAAGYGRKAA